MKNEPNRKRHGDHNRHAKPQPVPQKFDGCRKHAVSDKDTRADRDARCRAHKHTCRRNILRVANHAVIPALHGESSLFL